MTEFNQDIPRSIYRKITTITACIIIAFLLLILRLFFLQIVKGEEYRVLSQNNRIRLARLKASRGVIYDRNRNILTTTRPSYTAVIVIEDAGNLETELALLSRILNIPAEKFADRIQSTLKRKPFKEIILKRDLTFAEVATIEEFKMDLPGVSVEADSVRSYPHDTLASHLLGYMGEISEKQLQEKRYEKTRSGDQIGQCGLERGFNSYLMGQDGGKHIEVDAHGREVQILGFLDPVPGDNLILTIDLRLQKFIEELLGERSGAIVAINPQNGEILALVSHPSFNPNSFASGIGQEEWTSLTKNPLQPLRNRTIQSHYPPGSVFKLFVAMAGLEMRDLRESSSVNCTGHLNIGRWEFGCWKKEGHGHLSLHQAIVNSCNVFFYHAANKIGPEGIAQYAQLFGLGQPTGICLENEDPGFIPTPAWKERVFHHKWYPGETISMSIGQGYVSVTPLQMAVALSCIANGGTLYQPKLVRYILNSYGEITQFFPPHPVRELDISPTNLRIVQKALLGVVNEGGTGGRAKIPGILVAGKTGTAQVIALNDRADKKSIPDELKDHAWFCAYAPFEQPEIALAILVEHGGKGGATCAPLAKEIFLKYFQLKQGQVKEEGNV